MCQEEEVSLPSDPEQHLSLLHMEVETLSGERDLCALEASTVQIVGASGSKAWPPPVDQISYDLGPCEGVKCVDTGEPIPAALAKAAREREVKEVVAFKTFEFRPSHEVRGAKRVKAKWVDRWRGRDTASGGCKSRLVAMEIAYDLRSDTHAGTPTIAIIRYIISEAATAPAHDLMIHAVTCAFLHASMEGEAPIALLLPQGLAPESLSLIHI